MRKIIDLPIWASDLLYPAGAAPWNAQPTKVKPAGSKIAEGLEPSERPPADWLNWLLNQLTLAYQQNDAIEIQNWTPKVLVDATAIPVATGGHSLSYDPISGRIWCATSNAGSPHLFYSLNGIDWVDDTGSLPATPPLFLSCAVNPADGYFFGSGSTKCMSRTPLGVYTNFTLSGGTGASKGTFWDPYSSKFVFIGQDAGSHPKIWAGGEAPPTAQTLQNGSTYTGSVFLAAFGPTRKIGFYIITAPFGSQGMFDVDAYGNTWVDRGATVFNGTAKALHYSDEAGLFMAVDNTGFTYVSSDGINWIQQSVNATWIFQDNCLSAHGSIWFATMLIGSDQFMAWSKDNGVTWNRIPTPFSNTIRSVRLLDDRISAFDGTGHVAYALRSL